MEADLQTCLGLVLTGGELVISGLIWRKSLAQNPFQALIAPLHGGNKGGPPFRGMTWRG